MEESENDVGSREQLLLYADEHHLAGKLPLGNHLGKAMAPDHYTSCMGSVTNSVEGIGQLTRAPPHLYTVIICPQNKPGFITKHNLLPMCDIPH
ncbi:uncharacterized protein TNCV_3238691 [Trichonephila clavipes]|nr:uncharacterized protein TNCV_3238691 [Trichonephila clavipes]